MGSVVSTKLVDLCYFSTSYFCTRATISRNNQSLKWVPVTRIQRHTRSCNENLFFSNLLRANTNKVTVSNVQRRSRRRNGLDDNFQSFPSFSVHVSFQFPTSFTHFLLHFIAPRWLMAPAAPFSPTPVHYTFGITSIIDSNDKQ